MLERQRVGDGGHLMGIAAQHLDTLARLSGRVPLPEEVVGRVPCRTGSACQELNVQIGVSDGGQCPERPLDGD